MKTVSEPDRKVCAMANQSGASTPGSDGAGPETAREGWNESPEEKENAVAWVPVAAFCAFIGMGTALGRIKSGEFSGWQQLWVAADFSLSIAALVAVPILVRHRHHNPTESLQLLGLAQLVTSCGPAMGFALPAYLRQAPKSRRILASAIYILLCVIMFARDLVGQSEQSSFLRGVGTDTTGGDLDLGWVAFAFAVVVVIPIAWGMYDLAKGLAETEQERAEAEKTRAEAEKTRADAERKRAEQQRKRAERQRKRAEKQGQRAQAEQARSEGLATELFRQRERDVIARNIHDSIGHKLSLVTLQAGGLELAAGVDNPALAQEASAVRETAQQAVDDLRSLVSVMRDPQTSLCDFFSRSGLTEIGQVVDEVAEAGLQVTSTVVIDSASTAPSALSSAAYGIVEELLTNSVKHSPGLPLRLKISGGPRDGLTIHAANTGQAPSAPNRAAARPGSAGPGSAGPSRSRSIRECVESVGGRYSVKQDADSYSVDIWLPWK